MRLSRDQARGAVARASKVLLSTHRSALSFDRRRQLETSEQSQLETALLSDKTLGAIDVIGETNFHHRAGNPNS